jgi:hypothetical protein
LPRRWALLESHTQINKHQQNTLRANIFGCFEYRYHQRWNVLVDALGATAEEPDEAVAAADLGGRQRDWAGWLLSGRPAPRWPLNPCLHSKGATIASQRLQRAAWYVGEASSYSNRGDAAVTNRGAVVDYRPMLQLAVPPRCERPNVW